MSDEFSARQMLVNSSKLERLANRPSSGVAALASLVGWTGLSGQLVALDVGGAINVLILSIATQHGVEAAGMRKWLPRLRNETLVRLASDLSNWDFQGPVACEMVFNSKLYGSEAKVRMEVARMLGVNLPDTAALLRYHSSYDVECLTSQQMEERGHDGRAPRFAIYASTLAERVKAVCPDALFIASPKVVIWA